jgi:hypothetical protein
MAAPPSLPLRIGCPLALAVTATVVLAVSAAQALLTERTFELALDPISIAAAASPFLLLALAGVRDWLAWTVALALTGAVWAWLLYEVSRGEGAIIGLGFLLWLLPPIVISGAALVTAGLRGRIAWAADRP